MRGLGMELATPQTLADIQDQQAERERARRVKEANLAAYDAARREERSRSGGSVSATEIGPDGRIMSFSNTTIGPDGSVQREGFDTFDTQSRVGAEFADLARRSAMAQKHNARLGTDSLSAAMRAAMANGGRLPQNLVGMLSRNLGMDGNNQSVFSAGFLNNGDFDIDIVTRGANGGLQRSTRKITPQEQYGIVNATPGVWGNDGLAVSQRLYNGLRNTMGKSELAPPSVYADNLRAYNTKKQSADTMKMMMTLYQATMKDLSKGGKQPVTTDVIRARMASDLLKDKNIGPQITSVPDLNEDGTQKMTEDPNTGMQVPAMRQADPNNPDDVERVKQNLKMRLDLVPELAPRQGAQGDEGMNNRLAFLKYIYDRENPPTPPDVLAFQQGQRERQMRKTEEAQAREDVTERPQQLINYYKDGKWYSGNGYIIGGEVYDGNGYPIEGATPAEMVRGEGGRLVGDGKGGFATRALPSARELVSGNVGGGGGTAQAGQVDAQQPEPQAGRPATQGAQGGQQPSAQGGSGAQEMNAESVGKTNSTRQVNVDEKKRQLALMEAELKRRQSENASLDGPRVGKSPWFDNKPWNDKKVTGIGYEIDVDLPRNQEELNESLRKQNESLRQKELSLVKSISERGGKVWHDEDGGLHASIGNFEYLPKEEQDKYRDGIVSGLQLDAISDIQHRADAAAKDVAAKRMANLATLRSKANSMFQTERERDAYVNREDRKWRLENDPGFKDPDRERATNEEAMANLMSFFP